MKRGLKLLGLTLGVVAVAALTLGSTVFADAPEGTTRGVCGAGQGWHGFQGEANACSEVVSGLLGITPEELCAQRQEGKSLAEIAAAQGVSQDDLVAAIMAEKKEAVQARVDAGTLTPEQAELILQQMEQRTELAVTRTTVGPAEWRAGYGKGASYGDAGLGTGPGLMHHWGRDLR